MKYFPFYSNKNRPKTYSFVVILLSYLDAVFCIFFLLATILVNKDVYILKKVIKTLQMHAEPWSYPDDSHIFELMWIQLNSAARNTLIGALYHPPKPKYQPSTLLDFIVANICTVRQLFPAALVVLAGDFNRLPGKDIVAKCCLQQIVRRPTCGSRILDKIYVSESCYSSVDVVQPRVNSDHKAVVASNSDVRCWSRASSRLRWHLVAADNILFHIST